MIWNDHFNDIPEGAHAFLSPSNSSWLRYTKEKMFQRCANRDAAQKGTEDHEFAMLCIKRRQKLPKSPKTLNMYVNDAIGFRMRPEQRLYFSHNCFGTADAISFDEKKKILRVHDLKTGVIPASFDQLAVYAALFCLEYKQDPMGLFFELRIYQSDEVKILNPSGDDIFNFMELIKTRSSWVDEYELEVSNA